MSAMLGAVLVTEQARAKLFVFNVSVLMWHKQPQ